MNKSISVYSFVLKKRYLKNDNLVPLNDEYEPKTGNDYVSFDNAISMFNEFCLSYDDYYVDDSLQKMFSIDKKSIKTYSDEESNSMSFVIRSGNFGIEADMTNKNSKKVKYHRNKDDADIKKFICYVYILKDIFNAKINKGFIIFQSVANFGVKTITYDYLKKFFSNIGLTFEIRSISPLAIFDHVVEKGKIKELTVIRNIVSENITDNILITKGRMKTTYYNPFLKNGILRKIKNIFESKSKKNQVEMCEIFGENTEDICFRFDLGGKSRTIKLSSFDKLSLVEEIPKSIVSDEQILNYMKDTAQQYKEHLICY